VPRRYSVHPPGTEIYGEVASAFVALFAVGFLLLLFEVARLALAARGGGRPVAARPPPIAGAAPQAEARPALTSPLQIGTAVAIAVVASFALLPGISAATEGDVPMHHLAHAVQYLYGIALGIALGSTPSIFRRLAPRWTGAAIAAVIAASAAMLLAMVPAVYEPLQDASFLHGSYHLGIVALGAITGFGAALLGPTTGKLLAVLSVGMGLMYAAGVTGG
jgi:hypothetical protein